MQSWKCCMSLRFYGWYELYVCSNESWMNKCRCFSLANDVTTCALPSLDVCVYTHTHTHTTLHEKKMLFAWWPVQHYHCLVWEWILCALHAYTIFSYCCLPELLFPQHFIFVFVVFFTSLFSISTVSPNWRATKNAHSIKKTAASVIVDVAVWNMENWVSVLYMHLRKLNLAVIKRWSKKRPDILMYSFITFILLRLDTCAYKDVVAIKRVSGGKRNIAFAAFTLKAKSF